MADLAHKGIEVKPIKPEKSTVLVAKAPAVGTVSLVPASPVPGSDAPTGLGLKPARDHVVHVYYTYNLRDTYITYVIRVWGSKLHT